MPRYCFVPLCTNRKGGHKFPADQDMFEKWVNAIKRENPITKKLLEPRPESVVCCDHFKQSDYKQTLMGERKRLLPTAVPSIFPYRPSRNDAQAAVKRNERLERRTRQKEMREYSANWDSLNTDIMVVEQCVDDKHECNKNVAKWVESMIVMEDDGMIVTDDDGMIVTKEVSEDECEIVGMENDCNEVIIDDIKTGVAADHQQAAAVNESTQCNFLPHLGVTIERLEANPVMVKYYTGFEDYDHFMLIFNILGPNVDCIGLNGCGLSARNQLFLVLMKLRQAKDDLELSFFFGISEAVVSKVITTWVNFMYFQLKELNIWPSRETINSNMPKHFKQLFPSTRVILDATEIPIQKPTNANMQSGSFSSYKNRNTLKVMVGCTPKGAVSYISDAYGGRASDREIIERSTLNKSQGLFDKGDSIMADRGIMVQDLFLEKGVKVNVPTKLKGRQQLDEHEVIGDRRIASKRIHVERVIGLAKTYKILKKVLPAHRLFLGNRIINVCFMLTLFRKSIVSDTA